ncbi:MAG: TonB-dependent receptor plug domain-containing protein [Thiotrichales bacterium]
MTKNIPPSRRRRDALPAAIAGCLTLCGGAETSAGDSFSPGEEAFFEPAPTVVSATRLPQRQVHSPAATTLITRDMIAAAGFTELADVFRLVPGFQVAQATGSHYLVSYHGQERVFPDRIEVMVDGRSVYGNLVSSVNWKTVGVSVEAVERIEVVRGPNAPVFGANAFSATINIVTRTPLDEEGTRLSATTGSLDTRKIQLRHAAHRDLLDYQLIAGYRRDDGFDPIAATGQDFDNSRLTDLSVRAIYTPDLRNDFDLQLGYTGGDQSTLYAAPEAFLLEHDGATKSHYQSLRWTHKAPRGAETYVQFYHNYQDQSDTFVAGPLSRIVGAPAFMIPQIFNGQQDQTLEYFYADGVSERYDLELQQITAAGPATRVVWGAGLRLDRLESPHLDQRGAIDDRGARLFGNLEHTVTDALVMNLGLMLDYNEIGSLHGSARAAANYRLGDDRSLRASVSYTQRSPSILDEYWNAVLRFQDGEILERAIVSLGNLEIEKMTAYEIGYASSYFNGKLHADIKLFRESAHDLVSLPAFDDDTPSGNTGVPVLVVDNGSQFSIHGIEGQVQWQPTAADLLALNYSFTESDRYEDLSYTNNQIDQRYKNATPRATWGLLLAHRFAHQLEASLGLYHISKTRWLLEGTEVPAYNRLDLRLAKNFKLANLNHRVELIGQNLGDSHAEYIRGRNIVDPRYYVRLTTRF